MRSSSAVSSPVHSRPRLAQPPSASLGASPLTSPVAASAPAPGSAPLSVYSSQLFPSSALPSLSSGGLARFSNLQRRREIELENERLQKRLGNIKPKIDDRGPAPLPSVPLRSPYRLRRDAAIASANEHLLSAIRRLHLKPGALHPETLKTQYENIQFHGRSKKSLMEQSAAGPVDGSANGKSEAGLAHSRSMPTLKPIKRNANQSKSQQTNNKEQNNGDDAAASGAADSTVSSVAVASDSVSFPVNSSPSTAPTSPLSRVASHPSVYTTPHKSAHSVSIPGSAPVHSAHSLSPFYENSPYSPHFHSHSHPHSPAAVQASPSNRRSMDSSETFLRCRVSGHTTLLRAVERPKGGVPTHWLVYAHLASYPKGYKLPISFTSLKEFFDNDGELFDPANRELLLKRLSERLYFITNKAWKAQREREKHKSTTENPNPDTNVEGSHHASASQSANPYRLRLCVNFTRPGLPSKSPTSRVTIERLVDKLHSMTESPSSWQEHMRDIEAAGTNTSQPNQEAQPKPQDSEPVHYQSHDQSTPAPL